MRNVLRRQIEDVFSILPPDRIGMAVSGIDSPSEDRVRGFCVDAAVFSAILRHFNPGCGVTEAERRALFQLVAGLTLREAAELDGVGVETKRAQIKSAAAKLQCAGQIDLVRLMIGQLCYVLSIAEDEARHARCAERFVAEKFEDAILRVERLAYGRLARTMELGPADGRVVVVVHGMMFGMLLSGAAPFLHEAGLRLVMPLRHGYLDPRPILGMRGDRGRLIAESLEDIALLIEARGLSPAAILGHSLGAVLAQRFAEGRPDLVDRLVLVSTNTVRGSEGSGNGGDDHARRLYGALRSTASLSRAITLEFSRHYPSEATARTILHRMFGRSDGDIAALEGHGGSGSAYRWFPELYAASVAGVAADYEVAMEWRPCRPPATPTLFVHGSEDPLSPVSEIRELAEAAAGARLTVVEGAGHFASASHPAEVWSDIAAHLRA